MSQPRSSKLGSHKPRVRLTIRLRLTVLYGVAFLIAGFLLLGVNYALVRQNLNHTSTGSVSHLIVQQPDPANSTTPTSMPTSASTAPIGPAATEPNSTPTPTIASANGTILTPSQVANARTTDGLTLPQIVANAEKKIRTHALHEVLVQSSVALGLMALLSIALGWFLAGRALHPLHEVTKTAKRLSSHNLHERIAMTGPNDELKELADTFDAMLVRLDTSFDNQRRFVANASHELRTPLAVQRALVDVTLADPNADDTELRDAIVAISGGLERSERLIEALLTLARSEGELTDVQQLDVADIAEDVVSQFRTRAQDANIDLRLETTPLVVSGNAVLIERLFANLIENAIKYNSPVEADQTPFVQVKVDHEGISVANSGAIISADEAATLFEPFRRLQADRTGSQKGNGLGLSIVKAIATSHGGTASIIARDEGGLTISITLPQVIKLNTV